MQTVRDIVNALPETFAIGEITRLGGLTNLVYRVTTDRYDLCVRIPGEGTEAYINRRNEGRAAREAARVGVSAPVLHFDDVGGCCVTRFLSGTVTMSPDAFNAAPDAVRRAGLALRTLHDSDARFDNVFDVFVLIDDYLAVLRDRQAAVPDGYAETLAAAEQARAALARNPARLAPCHCDPLSENFLDAGDRMWIVDWEYSGMNDPLWDLGDFIVEAALSPENEAALLAAYFHRAPTPAEHGRVIIYKALCDLVWTLWGLIQHANENPADDFWAYALNRFDRCARLMATPEYRTAVVAVLLAEDA